MKCLPDAEKAGEGARTDSLPPLKRVMDILDLIRNAKDDSYVDFRTVDNQIDSVPIAELRMLVGVPQPGDSFETSVTDESGDKVAVATVTRGESVGAYSVAFEPTAAVGG